MWVANKVSYHRRKKSLNDDGCLMEMAAVGVETVWYPGQEKTPPETRQGRTEESYYALVARLRLKGESSLEAEFLPKIPGKMVIRRHKSKM